MANSIVYEEAWATKLQERLDHNNNWKEICRVEITNDRVFHNPYHTDPTVQSGTRGSAYTHQDWNLTDESVTINTFKILPMFIDRADLAQSTYSSQMELAEIQGALLDEQVETSMLAEHANWTDLGDDGTGAIEDGETGQISVSTSNVDDIIRAVLREIRAADGGDMLDRNGAFIVWRPEDFEKLEQFMQANGFSMADQSLKEGGQIGIKYMGVFHYVSNKHTANHLFAGVRNLEHLGIVRDTFGQIVIDSEPATSSGAVSAIAVISRIDYAFKTWNNFKPLLFDVNVA